MKPFSHSCKKWFHQQFIFHSYIHKHSDI